jgi:ubiquinone/menaquinone biosynthesis C-methylase UbiE
VGAREAVLPTHSRVPPYFDALIEGFWRGQTCRYVHLGYWDAAADAGPAHNAQEHAFARAQARLDAVLLDMAGVQDGQAVLDAGCGFGGTLARIDATHGRMRLVGINIDARQVNICRGLHAAPGNRFEWRVADACRLPFADSCFDRVLCVEAMFHFTSRRLFLAEAARVLKPGGLLVGSDIIVLPTARPLDTAAFPIRAMLQGGFGPWPDVWSDDADHVRLAEAAGLRGNVRDITANVLPSHRFTSPDGVDARGPGHTIGTRAALTLRWLHEHGHLRYVGFRFERPCDQARPR